MYRELEWGSSTQALSGRTILKSLPGYGPVHLVKRPVRTRMRDVVGRAGEKPATNPTTFIFQNHEIRTVKKDASIWFVSADVCQPLGIANSRKSLDYLYPKKINVVDGQEINDHNEFLLSIISESGTEKLVHHSCNPETKNSRLSRIRLLDIHTDPPGVTENILFKVQSLHLKATVTSKPQAVMDTMQRLRASKEYTKAIQHIDRTHEVYFDYPAKTTIGGL